MANGFLLDAAMPHSFLYVKLPATYSIAVSSSYYPLSGHWGATSDSFTFFSS